MTNQLLKTTMLCLLLVAGMAGYSQQPNQKRTATKPKVATAKPAKKAIAKKAETRPAAKPQAVEDEKNKPAPAVLDAEPARNN